METCLLVVSSGLTRLISRTLTVHRKLFTKNCEQKNVNRKLFTENSVQKTVHRKMCTENCVQKTVNRKQLKSSNQTIRKTHQLRIITKLFRRRLNKLFDHINYEIVKLKLYFIHFFLSRLTLSVGIY